MGVAAEDQIHRPGLRRFRREKALRPVAKQQLQPVCSAIFLQEVIRAGVVLRGEIAPGQPAQAADAQRRPAHGDLPKALVQQDRARLRQRRPQPRAVVGEIVLLMIAQREIHGHGPGQRRQQLADPLHRLRRAVPGDQVAGQGGKVGPLGQRQLQKLPVALPKACAVEIGEK